jgi:hypothetical protein
MQAFSINSALRRIIINLPLLGLLSVASPAFCAEQDVIVTDRPDFVESSNVVGDKHFQVETSVVIDRNEADGYKDRTISTPTLLRFGIGQAWELRFETDGRTVARSEETATGISNTTTGYADVSAGAKWHVMDESGSMPSIGLLGHVDVDSGSTAFRGNGVRPSLRAVAEWELPNDMGLGVMPGVIYDKNANDERFWGGILGVVLGKSWTERCRTFAEVAAAQIAHAQDGGSVVTFDVGASYLLSNSWQVDTAFYKGLNKNTADLAWTIGLSAKF